MHQNKRSNENIINVKQFSLEHHIYLNKELHVFNINVKSSIGAENVFVVLFRAQLIWFPSK